MSEDDDGSDIDDQWIQEVGLDAGSGTMCLEYGADWLEYLASAEIPQNVVGVDPSIEDFAQEGTHNV